jgi:sulfite reductase alpha subunit-like flavoprotein
LSREESKKVYVQDLLSEHAAELKRLVLKEKAHVYVCGDASRMAKDVFKTFAGLIDGQCGESGVEYLRDMKASGRWSEDVW